MKPNPPIPGHELIAGGRIHPEYDGQGVLTGRLIGGCRCGAVPPDFPLLSIRAMRRWHRQHKQEIREATS